MKFFCYWDKERRQYDFTTKQIEGVIYFATFLREIDCVRYLNVINGRNPEGV